MTGCILFVICLYLDDANTHFMSVNFTLKGCAQKPAGSSDNISTQLFKHRIPSFLLLLGVPFSVLAFFVSCFGRCPCNAPGSIFARQAAASFLGLIVFFVGVIK